MTSTANSPSVSASAYTGPMGPYNRIAASHAHFLLVNAPDAAAAGSLSDITPLLRHSCSFGLPPSEAFIKAKAFLLLGALSKAIAPLDYKSFFTRDSWALAAPGQDLFGIGTYQVEICIATIINRDTKTPMASLKTQTISVSRVEPTLDVDFWETSPSMSKNQLQDAIVSMRERQELNGHLASAAPTRKAAL